MSAIATYSIESLSGYRYPWYLPSWMRRLPLPLMEFWSFGVKEALSCAFAVSFFITLGLSKILPMGGIPAMTLFWSWRWQCSLPWFTAG